MMYSNKLNLDEFFFSVRKQDYVIIKMTPEFPNYYKGSDVDILCLDLNKFSGTIFDIGNNVAYFSFLNLITRCHFRFKIA